MEITGKSKQQRDASQLFVMYVTADRGTAIILAEVPGEGSLGKPDTWEEPGREGSPGKRDTWPSEARRRRRGVVGEVMGGNMTMTLPLWVG